MTHLLQQLKGYEDLDQRERQILHLLLQGHGNQKIADTLFLSVKNLEKILGAVYFKLHIKNDKEKRTELFIKILALCNCEAE